MEQRLPLAKESGMSRVEVLRSIVDRILEDVRDPENRRCGFVHLYGVSLVATWLARRRGENEDLAASAGMLHDIGTYETGDPTDHAARSANRARAILQATSLYAEHEIRTICTAIGHHSDKKSTHDPFSELLKDADVLQHILYNPALPPLPNDAPRREDCLRMLSPQTGR